MLFSNSKMRERESKATSREPSQKGKATVQLTSSLILFSNVKKKNTVSI
jgi:hypothetical protein